MGQLELGGVGSYSIFFMLSVPDWVHVQITAYGGQLRYAVYYEAREETGSSSYEPQVLVRGGPNKDLLMMRHTPGLQIGQLTRHEIDMTEVWGNRDNGAMYEV